MKILLLLLLPILSQASCPDTMGIHLTDSFLIVDIRDQCELVSIHKYKTVYRRFIYKINKTLVNISEGTFVPAHQVPDSIVWEKK